MDNNKNLENAKIIAQYCLQYVPTIVIGSGYSAGYGYPTVKQLSQLLQDTIDLTGLNTNELKQWSEFKELSKENGMEVALTKLGSIQPHLLERIVITCWTHFITLDKLSISNSIKNPTYQSLTRLLQYLFYSSNNSISIVTTNYDLLAEYAISSGGFIATTGFLPGLIGTRENTLPVKYHRGSTLARTANVWKVHGSIDWIQFDGTITRALLQNLAPGVVPQIITPGIEKYQRTLREPFRSILMGADNALTQSTAYLCIGYGFNDEHIQEKLVERVRRDSRPICIISKNLTEATISFIKTLKKDYLAIEENGTGSKIYTHELPNGFVIGEKQLWTLDGFLNWSIER
ncbi:SIR2 family protein [Bdellovibrio bacteriovorus]|uniref:SIR2 family protein n=1 Tax=Bdellovibrio bacteriovorus TaxID=959 RepID=UPI0035A730EF